MDFKKANKLQTFKLLLQDLYTYLMKIIKKLFKLESFDYLQKNSKKH